MLRRKLTRLDGWNAERRRLGAALRARLQDAPASSLLDPVRLPFQDADHVHHLFVVRCEQRDALRTHLEREGIASAIHYPQAIHRTEAYASLGLGEGSLPVSERLTGMICSLPLFPGMSEAELERVAQAALSFGAS